VCISCHLWQAWQSLALRPFILTPRFLLSYSFNLPQLVARVPCPLKLLLRARYTPLARPLPSPVSFPAGRCGRRLRSRLPRCRARPPPSAACSEPAGRRSWAVHHYQHQLRRQGRRLPVSFLRHFFLKSASLTVDVVRRHLYLCSYPIPTFLP
ncbi:hypothetical protein B0H19DRAFT_1381144, partial [Mycena capillaripes]